MKHIAYLSLGSNCADACQMLEKARAGIQNLENVVIAAQSSVYFTEPQDYQNQPWFANQVIKCEIGSSLTPQDFLKELLCLEKVLGRRRDGPRFGPRSIDIDLLLFDDCRQDTPDCILPHPRMRNRAFVLEPILEIEPDLRINGDPAREFLAKLNWRREGNKIYQTGFLPEWPG